MATELLLRIEETVTESGYAGIKVEVTYVRKFERTSYGIVEASYRNGIQTGGGCWGIESGERRLKQFAHLAR